MTDYKGPERREGLPFSDSERRAIQAMIDHAIEDAVKKFPVDTIADNAARKATEQLTNQLYLSVGRGVVQKFLLIVGVITSAVYLWLQSKGLIK